ncbi:hypothetical protein [Salipiger bermudensis]|uniref:hypothetical protein n=1 Tax=Salipiger bermudensis TaxID=344736 RepID=UPI001CD7528E|nr:hypothetical protein [Salipiger bermudensis]MCA1288521.1 hypothetical protein [Salipiger bermudensis]
MSIKDNPSSGLEGRKQAMPSAPITKIADFLDEVCPNAKTVYVFDRSSPEAGSQVARVGVESAIAWFDDPCLSLDDEEGEVLTVALKAHQDQPVEHVSMRMTGPDKTVICVYYLADPVKLADLPEGVFIDELPFPVGRWAAELGDEERLYRIDGDQIVIIEDEVEDSEVEASRAGGDDQTDRGRDDGGDRHEEPASAPQKLNDATLIGTECPEFEAMLEQEATFLTGKVYPDKPHKSTQAGQWKPVKMKFLQHIIGFEATSNSPAYGLSRHPVGKTKDGLSFVMGSSIGGQRKAKAMDTMYAIGLDIDSGTTLETVRAKILKMGVACFLYTSWNHGKSGVALKRDDVLKKLEIDGDPTLEQVHDYLRHHGKNRFEEGFIKRVTIAKQKVQEEDGVKIVLDTPPIDKLRLIFPLAEPVKIIELSERHDDALAIWEDKITGLAQKELGIHFDTSCTDPSRLFYTARHDQKSKDWVCEIVQGKPLVFDEITSMRKSLYTRNRDLNPFVEAGDFSQGGQVPNIFLPSGRSLNDWHSKYGKTRFQIADMLQTECPERIRVSGGEASGSVHTECPFEHLHSNEGGTATMATNALDSQSGYWTWFCHHDACQDRHKLEFLGEAIKEGWFPEEVLFSDDYLLPAEEEEIEDDPEDYKPSEDPEAPPEPKTPLELAQKITAESSDEDVKKLFKRLIRRNVGEMDKENVIADIAKRTPLGKKMLNKWWREIVRERKEKEAENNPDADDLIPKVNETDFKVLCEYSWDRIRKANAEEKRVFHYMENLCIVRDDAMGNARLKMLDQRGFAHLLNSVATFACEPACKIDPVAG